MNEQKIPGVKDAQRPPITEKAYAILTAITLVSCAGAVLVVAHLPERGAAVEVINVGLANINATTASFVEGAASL